MTTAECPCADCDLPAGHPESPDYDDIVMPRIEGKLIGHMRFVPIEDDQ